LLLNSSYVTDEHISTIIITANPASPQDTWF